MRDSTSKWLTCALVILLGIALALLVNFPVMWLWNWLMPTIFHLPTLTYWQMYGLTVLISLLASCFRRREK